MTRPDLIFPDLSATDRAGVLRALAERVAAAGLVGDAEELSRRLLEREQLGSTALGHGVAIPHCKLAGLPRGVVAVGLTRSGVDFGAADGVPVSVFFLVVSPSAAPGEHLQTLAAISRWLKDARHRERLRGMAEREAIYELLQEAG